MAKKNSTKTATKEALQASEPKLQVFKGWKGINIADTSPYMNDYLLEESPRPDSQTDEPFTNLIMQDNIQTSALLGLETVCSPELIIPNGPITETINGEEFSRFGLPNDLTGINCFDRDNLWLAYDDTTWHKSDGSFSHGIYKVNIGAHEAEAKKFESNKLYAEDMEITDIKVFLDTLIVLGKDTKTGRGMIKTAKDNEHEFTEPITGAKELEAQTTEDLMCNIRISEQSKIQMFWVDNEGVVHKQFYDEDGQFHEDDTSEGKDEQGNPIPIVLKNYGSVINFFYCVTNKYGSTLPSVGDGYATTRYFNIGPEQWTTMNNITISGVLSENNIKTQTNTYTEAAQYTGIDIYCTKDDATSPIFVGHTTCVFDESGDEVTASWAYTWFGAMQDTAEWSTANLTVPEYNTTAGVPARYCNMIDGRIYFYGDPQNPNRLWVGGNAGNELCVAIGVGGAFIDIEPGTGLEITMVEKFKTYGGSSIVTILCTNENNTKQKRFNLIETNITISSELSSHGYMVEEIANVVGCTSYHGGGAWADGLYYINRNGLMTTTQQMEYSSQLRSVSVSGSINPLFEEHKGIDTANAWVVYCDEKIYMHIACKDTEHDLGNDWDKFIWVYDIQNKLWYTMTPRAILNDSETLLYPEGMFVYDNEKYYSYGLGIVTKDKGVWVIPVIKNKHTLDTTMDDIPDVTLKTAELGTSMPITQWQYLAQLEFNFDHFVGDAVIEVEGVDYWGRRIFVKRVMHQPVALTNFHEWIRINTNVRYYRITITGKAFFRLTNIAARVYTHSKKIAMPYGYEISNSYMDRYNSELRHYMHEPVSCYNNLAKHLSNLDLQDNEVLLEDAIVT